MEVACVLLDHGNDKTYSASLFTVKTQTGGTPTATCIVIVGKLPPPCFDLSWIRPSLQGNFRDEV